MKSETLSKTENDKIFIEQQQKIDADEIMRGLISLDQAIGACSSDDELCQLMHELVPTYRTPEEVNARAVLEHREPALA